jgi:hypothetical protein
MKKVLLIGLVAVGLFAVVFGLLTVATGFQFQPAVTQETQVETLPGDIEVGNALLVVVFGFSVLLFVFRVSVMKVSRFYMGGYFALNGVGFWFHVVAAAVPALTQPFFLLVTLFFVALGLIWAACVK